MNWLACYESDYESGVETFSTKESALAWLEEQKEEEGYDDNELTGFHGYICKIIGEIKEYEIDRRENYKDEEEFNEKYPNLPADCDIVSEYRLTEGEQL
jgi:hypothetical protein